MFSDKIGLQKILQDLQLDENAIHFVMAHDDARELVTATLSLKKVDKNFYIRQIYNILKNHYGLEFNNYIVQEKNMVEETLDTRKKFAENLLKARLQDLQLE